MTGGLDYLRPFLPGLEAAFDDPDVSEIMIKPARYCLDRARRGNDTDRSARADRGGDASTTPTRLYGPFGRQTPYVVLRERFQ